MTGSFGGKEAGNEKSWKLQPFACQQGALCELGKGASPASTHSPAHTGTPAESGVGAELQPPCPASNQAPECTEHTLHSWAALPDPRERPWVGCPDFPPSSLLTPGQSTNPPGLPFLLL